VSLYSKVSSSSETRAREATGRHEEEEEGNEKREQKTATANLSLEEKIERRRRERKQDTRLAIPFLQEKQRVYAVAINAALRRIETGEQLQQFVQQRWGWSATRVENQADVLNALWEEHGHDRFVAAVYLTGNADKPNLNYMQQVLDSFLSRSASDRSVSDHGKRGDRSRADGPVNEGETLPPKEAVSEVVEKAKEQLDEGKTKLRERRRTYQQQRRQK